VLFRSLQNAAIKVFRFSRTFRAESSWRTWYCRIVIREALMMLRKKASERFCPLEDVVQYFHGNPTVRFSDRFEVRRELYRGVRLLSPKRRGAILMYLLGVEQTDNTLKSRRFQARSSLKKYFAERGFLEEVV